MTTKQRGRKKSTTVEDTHKLEEELERTLPIITDHDKLTIEVNLHDLSGEVVNVAYIDISPNKTEEPKWDKETLANVRTYVLQTIKGSLGTTHIYTPQDAKRFLETVDEKYRALGEWEESLIRKDKGLKEREKILKEKLEKIPNFIKKMFGF